MPPTSPQLARAEVVSQDDSLQATGSTPIDSMSTEELLLAYSQLRETTRKQALALGSAAHELKTPLAIMAGYLELLLSQKLGPLSEKQTTVLESMRASSARLQQFIQDFLTYSAFETGKLTMRFEPGDLKSCLHEVYSMWLPRYEDRGVALYFPEGDPVQEFSFDFAKVQRVASILLENAFLSTPTGGSVWLTLEKHYWERRTRQSGEVQVEKRHEATQQPNCVRISVSDTGSGIAPEFHQEIFDDFVSLRSSDVQATGLGLAIARRLVHAQQGKIWVESEPGHGSKFCFVLPLTPTATGELSNESA